MTQTPPTAEVADGKDKYIQNEEEKKRAAELVIANKELGFQMRRKRSVLFTHIGRHRIQQIRGWEGGSIIGHVSCAISHRQVEIAPVARHYRSQHPLLVMKTRQSRETTRSKTHQCLIAFATGRNWMG